MRVNLAKSFKYTGIFLIVVAAAILSYGVGALQVVGWLPGLSAQAFDISSWFDWSSWYGEIVHGVFNVKPNPTVLQLVLWLTYLIGVLTLFVRPVRTATSAHPNPASPPTDTAEPHSPAVAAPQPEGTSE